jgi:hypothetical protein
MSNKGGAAYRLTETGTFGMCSLPRFRRRHGEVRLIDARGDNASTEGETFEAVKQAVREIADLVKKTIIDKLNGAVVFVTADHGFLFQDKKLDLTDKNALKDRPAGALISKKRYLLGRDLPKSDMAYRGDTSVTAGADGGMQFWVPKGNNRFHFVGGSRPRAISPKVGNPMRAAPPSAARPRTRSLLTRW